MRAEVFAKLTKVDELKHEVWGLATEERVDLDGEVMDYDSSKPYFQEWSRHAEEITGGLSLGNLRYMHQLEAAGKLIAINFDDENKQIHIGAKVVDESVWQKVIERVLTGFSIGGKYLKTWFVGNERHFTCQPSEISVVDLGCLPTATIDAIKASTFDAIKPDGSIETRHFANSVDPIEYALQCGKAAAKAFADAIETLKATPKAPDGKFTNLGSGPLHDCLTAAGYTHTRSGSSTEHGGDTSTPTASYRHEASGCTCTVSGDSWSHSKHGSVTTGSGAESLGAHLESCHAKKAVGIRTIKDFLKGDRWTDGTARAWLDRNDLLVVKAEETFDSFRYIVEKHSSGCVMVPIPADSEPGRALATLRSSIPSEHLKGQGLEPEAHVTLRYGFKGDGAAIADYLRTQLPFTITFGKTAAFEPTEHSDDASPLHVEVQSDELVRLNGEVAKVGEWKPANFEYHPHATIAYVDPEHAQKYVGNDSLNGLTLTVKEIECAAADGAKTVVSLVTPQQEEKAMSDFTLTSLGGVQRHYGEAPDAFATRAAAEIAKKVAAAPSSHYVIVDVRKTDEGSFEYTDSNGQVLQVSDNLARFTDRFDKGDKKTKRVDGEDLPSSAFLIVGDPEDTSTWKLPVEFSTDEKTKSHLRNALARFDSMKGVSEEDKAAAWKKLVARCKQHGIEVSDDSDKAAIAAEILKAQGDVAKSMYDVANLSMLLSEIRYLTQSQVWEAEFEDDADNMDLAHQLGAWLNDGAGILTQLLGEELAELTDIPALKAAIQKGDLSMKQIEVLLKAAQGFSGHFKAAHSHHTEKAAAHMESHGMHKAAHETHKAMHEHHTKMAAHHAGDAILAAHHTAKAAHHKAMADHHMGKAAHHEKCHKSHTAMCAACKAMCDHLAGTEKAAGEVIAGGDDVQKAVESFGEALTKMQATVTALDPKAITDQLAASFKTVTDELKKSVTDDLKKSMTEALGNQIVDPGGRLGRPITSIDRNGMTKAFTAGQTDDMGSSYDATGGLGSI